MIPNQGQPNEQESQKQKSGANNLMEIEIEVPESPLLRIVADNQEPAKLCLIRILIIFLIALILSLQITIPNSFMVLNNKNVFGSSSNCNPSIYNNNKKVLCQAFSSANPVAGLVLTDIQAHNQFLLIYLKVLINASNQEQFVINQNVTLSAYSIKPKVNTTTNLVQLFIQNFIYNQTNYYPLTVKDMNLISTLNNGEQKLYSLQFVYDRILTRMHEISNDFILLVHFSVSLQLFIAENIQIQAQTINTEFTVFTIVIRGVLFVVSMLTCFVYLKKYFSLNKQDRILQIRFVAFGSVLLILFNDPFYSITILKTNIVSQYIAQLSVLFSNLFTINMLIFMIALWIFFLIRIYEQPDSKSTTLFSCAKSWANYVSILLLYGSMMALYLQYSYYAYENTPIMYFSSIFNLKINVLPTIIVNAVLLTALALYIISLFTLIIQKNCCKGGVLPWRHKNYLSVFPFFFVIFIVFFMYGGPMPYSYEGNWILFAYCFTNLFIFVMQYLYYTVQKVSLLTKPQIGNEEKGKQQQILDEIEIISQETI